MKKMIITIFVVLGLSACTDPEGAIKAAQHLGMKNVTPTGYSWLGCDGHSDIYSTAFTAIDQNGNPVNGVVCSGWFKGSTVRLFD